MKKLIPKYLSPGSNLQAINSSLDDSIIDILLPNITVKRSEDPIYILGSENPEYKLNFMKMYDRFDKDVFDRLLKVYREAGSPRIIQTKKDINYKGDNKYRPHYYKGTNIIYVPDSKGPAALSKIIAELSHPLLEKYGNNSSFLERLNPFYSADDYREETRYDFPNKFEYETHHNFLPIINDYIHHNRLRGLGFYTKKLLGNTNTIYNPTFEQLMDSAKTYNKRELDNNYRLKNTSERHNRNKLISMLGSIL